MLKRNISKEEILSLAKELNLAPYIELCSLIEGIGIERKKKTKVYLTTTREEVVESILSDLLDIHTSLKVKNMAKVTISHGEESYVAITNYGEVAIDKEYFAKLLNAQQDKVESTITNNGELLKNIRLTIIYVPEYNIVDDDSWRCILLDADKLVMVLDAFHVLYAGEKDFVKSFILPIFSTCRLEFAIGGAQHIKSAEWLDIIQRVKLQTGDKYNVFPFFTEEVSDEKKSKYAESEHSLSTILSWCQKNSLDLRAMHCKDIDSYKENVFVSQLSILKKKLEATLSQGQQGKNNAQKSEELVVKSRKHIEDNVNLFIESPLWAQMRTSTNSFANLFKKSLREDIEASGDIKQDAKSLPRYLSAIWEQFMEDQNKVLLKEFEKETTMLFEMMRLDIGHIIRNTNSQEIQDKTRKQFDVNFNVNTFFSRKTTSGDGLTDALTIGGVIAGIFVSPVALLAVGASEIIKIANKQSMDSEYKETMKLKIDEIIDKNKNELLSQAEIRFNKVAEDFKVGIMNLYDELLTSIKQTISDEEVRLSQGIEILAKINTLI